MPAAIHLRKAKPEDLDRITRLFQQTVFAVNAKDYSIEQLNAWAKGASNRQKWLDKIVDQYFLVAELKDQIAGFGSITNMGYLDFLYVHKDHQHHGIAKLIFLELEKFAMANNHEKIISDVSITGRPFFEKLGFVVVKEQLTEINGIELENYKMEKRL